MADLPRLSNDLIQQLRGIFFAKDRGVILSAFNWLGLPLIATPSVNPAVDNYYMYFKSDGGLYRLDWDGNEIQLTRGTIHPVFSVFVSSDILNVTGDGTTYTIIFDTELYDDTNNYNPATGIFTAPVTGRYLFNVHVRGEGLVAYDQNIINIVTSNRTYRIERLDSDNVSFGGAYHYNGSIIADMDENDTAYVTFSVSGGAKTVDVGGGAATTLLTYFQGYLLI